MTEMSQRISTKFETAHAFRNHFTGVLSTGRMGSYRWALRWGGSMKLFQLHRKPDRNVTVQRSSTHKSSILRLSNRLIWQIHFTSLLNVYRCRQKEPREKRVASYEVWETRNTGHGDRMKGSPCKKDRRWWPQLWRDSESPRAKRSL